MPDLAQLNLVIDSSQVTLANNNLNIMIGVSGKAEVAIKNLAGQSDKLAASSKNSESAIGGLMKMVLGLAAAYLSLQSARQALESASVEENMEKGFTNILGSAQKAKDMLSQIQAYSSSSQFGFEGLEEDAKKMLALGMSADQVVPTLKAIGDEMTALGNGADSVSRVTDAFGRMEAEGRVSARTMRELTMANIPAWQILASAIGTDVPRAMKLVQAGAIDSNAAIKVLTAGMRDNADAAINTDKTVGELYNQLKNNLLLVLGKIGEEFIVAFNIKGKLAGAVQFVQEFGMVISDVFNIMEGLPPKFSSVGAAATTVVAVIRALVAIFEVMLALSLVKFLVDGAAKLFTFAEGLTGLTAGGKAAIIALLALVGIEVGRWAMDNFKPVALFVAKLEAAGKLFAALSSFTGASLGSLFTPKDASETAADTEAANKLREAYEDTMKAYDKMQTDINNRPDKPLTSFTDKVKTDIGSAQHMIEAFLGGSLDLKLPNKDQMDKELKAYMESTQRATAGSSSSSGSLITLDPVVRQQMQQMIDQTKSEIALIGVGNNERTQTGQILKELEALKKQGLTDDDQAQQYLIANGVSLQTINDLWDKGLVKSQEAVKLLGQMYEGTEKLKELQQIEQFAKGIGDAFANAFSEFVSGTKSAKQAVQDLMKSVEQLAIKTMLTTPLSNMMSGAMTNITGKLTGLLGGGGSTNETPVYDEAGGRPAPEWHGDVFGPNGIIGSGTSATGMGFPGQSGSFRAFAAGGVFDSPTGFNYGGGKSGVLGEAGPEAVIPLKRGNDGKLGLAGGNTNNVTQNTYHTWNIQTPNADTFRKSGRQIMAQMNRSQAGGIS